MTRNISLLFLEVKIQTDVIRKYLGMPIILQLAEDMEQEHDGHTFSGILTDVEDNQIYMENTSLLDDENGKWIEWGDDFIRLDPTRRILKHLQKMQNFDWKTYNQFTYVKKRKS